MNNYIKGAVIGGVWGLFPSLLAFLEDIIGFRIWPLFEWGIMKPIGVLLMLPTKIAMALGFRFYMIILGALVVGILIGLGASIAYEKLKK